MSAQVTNYRDLLSDDESLAIFLGSMKKFEKLFVDSMANREPDFTLKFEIRGDRGNLLHCRVNQETIARPKAAGKRRND